MKVVAAYLLAVLGGNSSPSSDDLVSILESGPMLFGLLPALSYLTGFLNLNPWFWFTVGAESDVKRINLFLSEVKGKDITELIASGREKFASVPTGGAVSAVAVAAPGGGAGAAPAAEEPKKEEKVEEKEESDDVSFSFLLISITIINLCFFFLSN